jgi:dTDP-4-dehydrorhamnose 3,5-epimerase
MKIIRSDIADVLIIEPLVHGDERGFFFESYNEQTWKDSIGFAPRFVQANHSKSGQGVLRGLHYQIQQPQGKLVSVIRGEIFDVAVDLRKSSESFGKWVGLNLSAENKRQLWVPPGFAHGFLVLSEVTEVLYMATDFYAPRYERSILWNDPDIGIDWPLTASPVLSEKDSKARLFRTAEYYD